MEKKKRIHWIDLAKGFGIILVILGHMPSIPSIIHNWIYSYHMPLFFILSGFLYKKQNIGKCLKDTFIHCGIPYVIYSLIFIFIDFIIFGYNNELNISIKNFLVGQGSFEILWFFISLFIIQNVYNLINNIFYLKKKIIATSIGISIIAYILTIFKIGIFFKISTSLVSIIFFMIGNEYKEIYAKKEKIEKKSLKMIILLTLNILFFSVNSLLGFKNLDINSQEYGLLPLTVISACMGSLMIILFSMIFEKNILFKPIIYIGKNSKFFFPLTAYIPVRFIKLLEIKFNARTGIYIKLLSKIVGIIIIYLIVEGLKLLKKYKIQKIKKCK